MTNHEAHVALNDQLAAQLGALDADLDAGPAIPGAPPPPDPEQQAEQQRAADVAEVADMLGLAVSIVAQAEPLAAKHYGPDARQRIAVAYVECAERYGWTWHKSIGSDPRVGLAVAVALPAFLLVRERRALQAAAAEKQPEGKGGDVIEAGAAPAPGDDGRVV